MKNSEVEKVEFDLKKINRLEVINHAKNRFDVGRLLTLYSQLGDFKKLEFSIQDDDQTLKIFIS